MGYKVRNKGGDFELVDAGTHLARCYMIVDVGLQKSEGKFGTRVQEQIILGFELVNEKRNDGENHRLSRTYTSSTSKKSNLGKDLEAWARQAVHRCRTRIVRHQKSAGNVPARSPSSTRSTTRTCTPTSRA